MFGSGEMAQVHFGSNVWTVKAAHGDPNIQRKTVSRGSPNQIFANDASTLTEKFRSDVFKVSANALSP